MSGETALLDACALGVLIAQDGRVAYANPAICRLLGWEPQEIVGRDASSLVHPGQRQEMTARLTTPTQDAESTPRADVHLLRRDGTMMSLFAAGQPCTFGGRPALMTTLVDVAGIRQLLGLGARAADMMMVSRLAAGIAHDFNNLLLVIGGHTERLLSLPHDEQVHASVLAIQEAAHRATLLTDHLLSFGQQQQLTPQTLDLSVLLGDVEELLRRRVGDTIRLEVQRPKRVPPIKMDRGRLVQVLLHLVDTARGNTAHGGTIALAVDWVEADEAMRLNRRWLPRGWFVRLQVVDNGFGVPAETLNHLFEPFFQFRPDSNAVGMGLATVYGLVKQSKGYIFVESAPGEGTRVTVLFPPALVDQHGEEPASAAPSGPNVQRSPLVLLVEDESAVRELLTETLRTAGFDVLAAESAEDAVTRRTERPVDVLVADVDLPGRTGAELARELRTRHPALRVVLMSGYGGEIMLEGAAEDDRLMLLRKPFSSATLVARLREMTARE